MVSVLLQVSLICLVSAVASSGLTEAAELEGKETGEELYDVPKAQDRKFDGIKRMKLTPLIEKKNWLFSLFTRTADPDPPTVHPLAPVEQYPIWRVHKYKGIELHPVQVVDVPTALDYSAAHTETSSPIASYLHPGVEYAAPVVEPLRMPHLEYGPPVMEYAYQGGNKYQIYDDIGTGEPLDGVKEAGNIVSGGDNAHHLDVHSNLPQVIYHGNSKHAEKFRSILGLLKSHKNIIAKLKNLKSWKHNLKQVPILTQTALPSPYPTGFAVPSLSLSEFPEVQEIPVRGLEHLNIPVPELPPINLASYAPAFATVPYLRVKFSNPLPVVNYAYSAPQSTLPAQPFYQPVETYGEKVQSPYYGTPPLFDSYGTPLPPDAYSSAASDPIPSLAAPENVSQIIQVKNDIADNRPESNMQTLDEEDTSATKAFNGSEQPIQLPVTKFSVSGAEGSPEEENSESG